MGALHLAGNRVAQQTWLPATVWTFRGMPPFRRFHSIAALCGNGLRPELQALFERLAVDPHSEILVGEDCIVQPGPDPSSAQAPFLKSRPRDRHLACGPHRALGPTQKMLVGKSRYGRAFTTCRLQSQGLFTAFCTETYPGFSQAFPHEVSTGNPQASPRSHPPVFHSFSTACRPTHPQANSRPLIRLLELFRHPALRGALDFVGNPTCQVRARGRNRRRRQHGRRYLSPPGHEMPDDPAVAGVVTPAMVRGRCV